MMKRAAKNRNNLRIVAHDLRNPISGILTASEYLLGDLPDAPDEHVALLQAIYASSQVMLRLVDEILGSSTIKSGDRQFRFQPTDLVSLVKQNLSMNRLLADRERVRIHLIAGTDGVLVSTDPLKLYQVIDKLVTNAIRFSYPGGRIEIRVGVRTGWATLSVRDRGTGMSAETASKVVRPTSERRPSDPQEPEQLCGLGTAIRIVENHGGRIRLESSLGSGSKFTVSLPLEFANPRLARRSRGLREAAEASPT